MSSTLRGCTLAAAAVAIAWAGLAFADETCNSPYMTRLIKGQEDYVHVWTLGVEGVGDGSDKLVTIDANPKSKTYGKVVHTLSVRRSRRGPPHGLHRRSQATCGPGGLDDIEDLRLRRRHRPGEAEARARPSPICRRRPASSGRTRSTRCRAAC